MTYIHRAMNFPKKYVIILAIISGFFILGVMRFNDLSIYTDSTRYVIWGNSFAHGQGLIDNTQPETESYIVNAPFFAVILSPVFLFFPFSVLAAKIGTLTLASFAVFLFFIWSRKHLGKNAALFLSFLFAFNPFTLVLSTEVLSETSFLVLIFIILILTDRFSENPPNSLQKSLFLLLIAVLPLVREIGFALAVALILTLLLSKKIKESFAVFVAAALPYFIWTRYNTAQMPITSQSNNIQYAFEHFVTPPDASFIAELVQRLIINGSKHLSELGGMIAYAFPGTLIAGPGNFSRIVLSAVVNGKFYIIPIFSILFAFGIFSDLRKGLMRLLFLFVYLCIVFLYPVLDVRFLFPIFPFALFYVFLGLREVFRRTHISIQWTRRLSAAGFLLLALPNLICIAEIIRTNQQYLRAPSAFKATNSFSATVSFFSTPWSLLGKWFEEYIPEGSIVASPYKDIAPFAPKCKFLEINRAVPLPMFESLLRDEGANYVLTSTIFGNIPEYFTAMTESGRFQYELLTTIGSLRVYAIHNRLTERGLRSNGVIDSLASINAAALFVQARHLMRSERYTEALEVFAKLEQQYPNQPEICYQKLILHALMTDRPSANADLQRIYTLSANTYISPSNVFLHAAQMISNARIRSNPGIKADELYAAGKILWELGCNLQAYHLLQEAVQADSGSFTGLLWAWHFGNQLHAPESKGYLKRLDAIDATNPVVRAFHTVASLQDSLARTSDPDTRSRIFDEISSAYDGIELITEAFDAAEQAIGESPKNAQFWRYLAALYIKHNNQRGNEKALQKALHLDR